MVCYCTSISVTSRSSVLMYLLDYPRELYLTAPWVWRRPKLFVDCKKTWQQQKNHKVVLVGRDLRRSRVHSLPKQGHPGDQTKLFKLFRVLSSWILKKLQGLRFHSLYGPRFPVPDCPDVEKVLIIYSWNFSSHSIWPLFLVLMPYTVVKSLASSSRKPTHRSWQAAVMSPWSCFFSILNKPIFLSLSSQVKCSMPWPLWWPCAGLDSVYLHRCLEIWQLPWASLPLSAVSHGNPPSWTNWSLLARSPGSFAPSLPQSPLALETHYFIVTASRIATRYHIPNQFFLGSE